MADVHGRVKVQPDELVPAGQPQIEERHREIGASGVVHHDVDVPEAVDRGRYGRLHGVLPGDVGRDNVGLAPGLGCLFRGRGESVLAARHQRKIGSRLRERDGDRLPDAARRAGDECFLPGQVEGGHVSPSTPWGAGQRPG